MNTHHSIIMLQKNGPSGSVMLRWSDEPDIVGYGLHFDMAANDLAERRDKAGKPARPTALHYDYHARSSLAAGNPRRFDVHV